MSNLALFADLNSMRLSAEMLEDIIEKTGLADGLIFSKFYNYDNKRHKQFFDFITKNGSETAVPLASRKKIRVDMRLVIDAVRTCCENSIDAVLLITGEVELLPLLASLKSMGIKVIMAVEGETQVNLQASERIVIERIPEMPAPAAVQKKAPVQKAKPASAPIPVIEEEPVVQIASAAAAEEIPEAVASAHTLPRKASLTTKPFTAEITAESMRINDFIGADGEIATDLLLDAIRRSGLAENEKLTQEDNLKRIKEAIINLSQKKRA